MGGFFGVISQKPCSTDLFYGIDYHSHLGTKRAGMVTREGDLFHRSIHDIENSYFRTKFSDEIGKFAGNLGIGVISDTDAQPIAVNSHLGRFAIATVARINNIDELVELCLNNRQQFAELSSGTTNPTELVALLITQGETFIDGINNVYNKVKGSCSMLILTDDGIIAARDFYGRTPIVIGKKEDGYAVASDSHSYINLDYNTYYNVGPGEIVKMTADGYEVLRKPNDKMQVCSFMWVYFGFPSSDYEGINVDKVRCSLGQKAAKNDPTQADFVCGIPDSGIGHAIGYAIEKGIPYKRGIVKYTPTWPRSFTPANQEVRNLVAKMKLIPNRQMLDGQRVVFCDDSIVRGTQLRGNVTEMYDCGAKEIHMRIACPPLVYSCRFLNFSASKKDTELITRSLIEQFEGKDDKNLAEYVDDTTEKHKKMVEEIRKRFGLTSLKFNTVQELVEAIGLPKEKLCTHCFDGSSWF